MFQGGINAAYGLNAIFMVESVMATSRPNSDDRERRNRKFAEQRARKQDSLFADILGAQTEEMREAPAQFKTVVYGRSGKVVATQYQTREYV